MKKINIWSYLNVCLEVELENENYLRNGFEETRKKNFKAKRDNFNRFKKGKRILNEFERYMKECKEYQGYFSSEKNLKYLKTIKDDFFEDYDEWEARKSIDGAKLKHLKLNSKNGFFISIGVIGLSLNKKDILLNKSEKIKLAKFLPSYNEDDFRAREKFYISIYNTLTRDKFLSFNCTRKEIREIILRLFNLPIHKFTEEIKALSSICIMRESRFVIDASSSVITFELKPDGIYNKKTGEFYQGFKYI